MSGPIMPTFDPEFFRELLSAGQRGRKPTSTDVERAMAMLLSRPMAPTLIRACWTVAEYLYDGGTVDTSGLGRDATFWVGLNYLVIATLDGPHNDSYRALTRAAVTNDADAFERWLIDFHADHVRLRDSLAEAAS